MSKIDLKRANRILKKRPAASAFIILLIFVLLCATFVSGYYVFALYSVQLKMTGEADSLYNMYSTETDPLALLRQSKRDSFTTDSDGRIISGNKDNSCCYTAKPIPSSYFYLKTETDFEVYADKKSDMLIQADQDGTDIKLLHLFDTNSISDAIENKDMSKSIPYWIAFPTDDGGKLFIRTYLDLSVGDVIFTAAITGIFAFAFLLILIVLFVYWISNLSHRKSIRKLIFMDRISGNHNWMWFLIRADKIINKRRNLSNSYAVVNLVFARYRNFVLCHSIEHGERMLSKIYLEIASGVGPSDLAAHSTEAHFPLLIRFTDEETLRSTLNNIISKLESIEKDHKFGFHAGVAVIPPQTKAERRRIDLDNVYNFASAARMQLGEKDESGIMFFDNKLLEEQKWIDKVTEKQKDALKNEEFIVYYQPKYDPVSNKLQGAEALIRWQNDELGFISPGRFIPIFENNGFITEIDHYMIEHVARNQAQWLSKGYDIVPVSVNVSRAHFIEDDLAEQIRDIAISQNCPPEYIEIELTESAFFDDKDKMIETIKKLQSYGFAVSMDDFGSGYSSLNSLKDLPLNILKLDAGFFSNGDDLERSEVVVAEAIKLAKNLNMKTVAEGIEEKPQVDFLAREGCDMIQGYYFAKPMPASDYEDRMNRDETVSPSKEASSDTPGHLE